MTRNRFRSIGFLPRPSSTVDIDGRRPRDSRHHASRTVASHTLKPYLRGYRSRAFLRPVFGRGRTGVSSKTSLDAITGCYNTRGPLSMTPLAHCDSRDPYHPRHSGFLSRSVLDHSAGISRLAARTTTTTRSMCRWYAPCPLIGPLTGAGNTTSGRRCRCGAGWFEGRCTRHAHRPTPGPHSPPEPGQFAIPHANVGPGQRRFRSRSCCFWFGVRRVGEDIGDSQSDIAAWRARTRLPCQRV